MKTEFEMTEADMKKILDACKPVPAIMLQCGTPSSPQENANRAWESLGKRMGFKHMTVEPVRSKGQLFFKAEAVVAESPKDDR